MVVESSLQHRDLQSEEKDRICIDRGSDFFGDKDVGEEGRKPSSVEANTYTPAIEVLTEMCPAIGDLNEVELYIVIFWVRTRVILVPGRVTVFSGFDVFGSWEA